MTPCGLSSGGGVPFPRSITTALKSSLGRPLRQNSSTRTTLPSVAGRFAGYALPPHLDRRITKGSINESLAHPRDIFRPVIGQWPLLTSAQALARLPPELSGTARLILGAGKIHPEYRRDRQVEHTLGEFDPIQRRVV